MAVLLTLAAGPGYAGSLANNTPGFVKKAVDTGAVDPATVITVTAWLELHNKASLDSLVKQQTTRGSGKYHAWITQQQFNASYGPTANEVNAVQNYLSAHNLTVLAVAENNLYVKVQGTVGDIQKTFHTKIHNFKLNGVTHRSNTATYTGNRYGSDITNGNLGHLPPCGYQPSELHTAYNMNGLYANGLDGTGETVVVIDAFGSDSIQTDAEVFSQLYGLPDLTPANFQVMHAPGALHNPGNGKFGGSAGWKDEITLDVEWVHAMAPGANIVLLISPNNGADLDETVNFAVIHHLGNTISNSWSGPEGFGNPAGLNRVERILEMAAAEGIDVNFSSGDSGDNVAANGLLTVDYPGSSTFATSVGGTSLFVNSDNTRQFETGWGTNLTRIADTIAAGSPPVVPPSNDPALGLGFQFGAGGGASLTFSKPAFQAGLPGNSRLVPDIGWLADPFTGVEIIETLDGQLGVGVIGGTSLACPMFSAIMAIAAQKAGHSLGQAAPLLYNLPSGAVNDVPAVSSATNVTGVVNGAAVTADQLAAPLGNTTAYVSALYNSPFSTRWFVITFGTDSSLTTAPGWDNVTGVGTPNGANFVNALAQ